MNSGLACIAAFGIALTCVSPSFAETDTSVPQDTTPRFLRALFAPQQTSPVVRNDDMRAVVKQAVALAIENRPKGRLWCVPFARSVSGVSLKGNALTWWQQAKGRYERGNEPRIGAVMNFAPSRAMPKGHVAVVSKVISEREILVDHANWERNRISLDNLVVDVSDKGDWSVVRVANGAGTLGRTNPVFGFIYN
jgi:hypothetical protein